MRERRHALDGQIHREFMTWLDALERAGYEQAHDDETVAIIARHRWLTAKLVHSKS
jgi:truncated hemoglobin YjbI